MNKGVCFTLTVTAALLGGLASCSAPKPDAPAKSGSKQQQASSANTMRFVTWKCVDDKGIGSEVFHLLRPADWKAEGGIQWKLDNPNVARDHSLSYMEPEWRRGARGLPKPVVLLDEQPGAPLIVPTRIEVFRTRGAPNGFDCRRHKTRSHWPLSQGRAEPAHS